MTSNFISMLNSLHGLHHRPAFPIKVVVELEKSDPDFVKKSIAILLAQSPIDNALQIAVLQRLAELLFPELNEALLRFLRAEDLEGSTKEFQKFYDDLLGMRKEE